MASLSKRRKRERACDDTVQRGKADRDTGNNTFTEQDRMWEWCGISDPLEKTIKCALKLAHIIRCFAHGDRVF